MVRFAVKIAGKTGKRKLRSGREGAGIGFAARVNVETKELMQRSGQEDTMVGVAAWKHTEMGLWVQRSGREGVVVGLAAWEHVETDGRRHDGTCTGAAKRTGEGRCGLRYVGNGDKQRRTDGNRARDARDLRSGWEDAGIRLAVRKQAEMDLWVQRSGQEDAGIGVAARENVETKELMLRSGRERAVVGFAEREGRGGGEEG